MEDHFVSPIPKQLLLASKSLQVSPTQLVAPHHAPNLDILSPPPTEPESSRVISYALLPSLLASSS